MHAELTKYQQRFAKLRDILEDASLCLTHYEAEISNLTLENYQWLQDNVETIALSFPTQKLVRIYSNHHSYFCFCPNKYLSQVSRKK